MCLQLGFLKLSSRSVSQEGAVVVVKMIKKHGWKMKIIALISSLHERSFLSLPIGATPAWRESLNRPIYRAIRDHIFMPGKKYH